MMILRWILIVTGLIIIFRILNLISRYVPLSGNIKHHISYALPLVEFVAWCTVFWWLMKGLSQSQSIDILIVAGIIIVFFAITLFYLLLDFVFGLYLKILQITCVGYHVTYDDFKGVITRTGPFSLDIKNKHNDIKTIPYRKIKTNITSRRSDTPFLFQHLLFFQLPASDNTSQQVKLMLKHILNSPWHVASTAPIIDNISRQNGTIKVAITVFVISISHADKIRDMLQKVINENHLN